MSNIFEQAYSHFYQQHLQEAGVMPPQQAGQQPAPVPGMGNDQMDADDQIPNVDAAVYHPAVTAAHQAFLVVHDALCDDPTDENVQLFEAAVGDLIGAIRQYILGGGGAPGEEVEMEGDELVEEEPEIEDPADEDDEEAPAAAGPPAKKKPNPFQKKESNPTRHVNAQTRGVGSMNTLASTSPFSIDYSSTGQGKPWVLSYGEQKLDEFDSREQAEHLMGEIMAQAQASQPMSGKEKNYTKSLLPKAPGDISATHDSVMGGEEQDFEPPIVFTPQQYLESQPEVGSLYQASPPAQRQHQNHSQSLQEATCAERPVDGGYMKLLGQYNGGKGLSMGKELPKLAMAREIAAHAPGTELVPVSPSCMQLIQEGVDVCLDPTKATGADQLKGLRPPTIPSANLTSAREITGETLRQQAHIQESINKPVIESGPFDGFLREAQCPACSGLGCIHCGQDGKVAFAKESELKESIYEGYKSAGNALMAPTFAPEQDFYGTYQPGQVDMSDPMQAAYDHLNYAKSRH